MTFTYDESGHVRKVIADWVSDDTTGAVSGTTKKIVGQLVKVVTDPGSAAPTDNYDIAITDGESVDVLGNCVDGLLNRHTSTTQEVYLLVSDSEATTPRGIIHPVVCDLLTIAITAAGNSKTGQVIIYHKT
jgi:hypothetical protein